MQYGFAGFCFVLIGLIFWMIKDSRKTQNDQNNRLLGVIEKNSEVIATNTAAVGNLLKQNNDSLTLLQRINERQIAQGQ